MEREKAVKLYREFGYLQNRQRLIDAFNENDSTVHASFLAYDGQIDWDFCPSVRDYLVPQAKRFLLEDVLEKHPEARLLAMNFLARPEKAFLIVGGPGVGKTVQAYAMLFELSFARAVEFVDWGELLEIFSAYAANKSWAHDELRLLRTCDSLVIDDLGRTSVRTDARFEGLFRLIDYRNNRELPTVYTTNLSSAELEQSVGSAIRDRVSDGVICKLTGPSLRREF